MGGCHSRTPAEVTADLEADLLASAKRLLQSEFGQSLDSNHDHLQDTVEALAKAEFKQQFKYDWDPNSVSPPNRDSDNPQTHIAYDYCLIASDDSDTINKAIAKYVNDGLAGTGLDDWMKNKAVADLVSIVSKFITQPLDSNWHCGIGGPQYDAANTDEDSYKLDLAMAYTNATKTESAVEATLHIFYFVGVYYTIASPKAVTFGQLRGRAWDAASNLPNVSQKPVKSDTDLGTALFQWSTSADGPFAKDFRPWGTAPDDFRPGSAVKQPNNVLAFFNTDHLTQDYLQSYVDSNIISGFGIKDPNAMAWLRGNLLGRFQSILSGNKTSGWTSSKLIDTYGWGNASLAPLRLDVELIYWNDNKPLTDANQETTVYVKYIYVLGLVYELKPDPILTDLCRNIIKSIPHVDASTVPTDPKPSDVLDAMYKYNSDLYTKAFKESVDWHDKSPPKEPAKVRHFGDVFEFVNWTPSLTDIQKQVDKKIFKRDYTGAIKNGLQPVVYDWIVDTITESCTPNFAPDPNAWFNITNNNGFPYTYVKKDKTETPCILDVEASFAFSKATITEAGPDGSSETLQHYYICAFITATAQLDNDDDPLDV